MKPLISILIPAYNARQWLADAIDSALAQTWPNKEIIIVDDGSKDETLTVAKRFEAKKVKVVTQPNQGASAARNHAYSLCQGDYIQWLDADDLLAPDKIVRQMKAVQKVASPKTLHSCAWGYFMYRPAKAQFSPTPLWDNLAPVEWLYRKMSQNLHMQPDTWLVSRELTDAAGPWNTQLWRDNDGEYFCRVVLASDGIRFTPEAKSYYRKSGSTSISFIGRSAKKQDSLFLSLKLHVGYLLSLEDSERTRKACVNYLQTWFHNFYPERVDLVSQAQELAASLGGKLEAPSLSWKYAWIQKCFGWTAAKQAQRAARNYREDLARSWDKVMFRLENGMRVSN